MMKENNFSKLKTEYLKMRKAQKDKEKLADKIFVKSNKGSKACVDYTEADIIVLELEESVDKMFLNIADSEDEQLRFLEE